MTFLSKLPYNLSYLIELCSSITPNIRNLLNAPTAMGLSMAHAQRGRWYNRVVHIATNIFYTMHTLTCVCSLVKPRIQRICPALGFLSESRSNFSSPIAIDSVYSSGCPLPHLLTTVILKPNKHLRMTKNALYNFRTAVLNFFTKFCMY